MSLEDDARRREEQRQARAESTRRREEEAAAKGAEPLAALLAEFAEALRRRNVPTIPVYDFKVVKLRERTERRPTRTVLGRGWLFSSYHDDGESWSSHTLFLMADGATLIEPYTGREMSRRWKFPRSFWPRGQFVCQYRPFRLSANPGRAETIEAIREGMVRFLDSRA
ncbi:hypothetical protein [Streptomyces sp. NPDC046925]|uniref:hypothetical protein n=1 Tax=Streptomyces sp. NPDC046925 TaxID=3155375 RepID=UPI0033D196A8